MTPPTPTPTPRDAAGALTAPPVPPPARVSDLGAYWPLYAEAFRVQRRGVVTLAGRRSVSDDELRRWIDASLAMRPRGHCNAEHAVATALHRLICTGPRWYRLWTERVALAAITAAHPGAEGVDASLGAPGATRL